MIAQQAAGLWEGGADFVIFETQPSRAALEQCAAAMRRQPSVPFILSCMVVGQGESPAGEPIEHSWPLCPTTARSRSPGALIAAPAPTACSARWNGRST